MPCFYRGLEGWAIYLLDIYVSFIYGIIISIIIIFLYLFTDYRYELAEECADDDDAKISISELRKAVLEELKMHNSFVQVK